MAHLPKILCKLQRDVKQLDLNRVARVYLLVYE
jgi:hypothetical protein